MAAGPSMTRVAAGAFGFLIFSHAFDGQDLYGGRSMRTSPLGGSHLLTLGVDHSLFFFAVRLRLILFCFSLFGHVIVLLISF
jgi:hypothetical protein